MKSLKKNTVLKDFWRDNARFAALFNGVLFEGREVIKPECLEEKDTDVSGIILAKEYAESLERARDVVKKAAYGIEFVILGLENQDKVHYAMPLRVMIYDALEYLKEYQELTRKYRDEPKKLETPEEFLSKMCKGDRLHPVITIVIYYGEDEWDGPISLADMTGEVSEDFQKVFSDYSMNLLQVRDSGRYEFRNKEVQMVFEIVREIQIGEFRRIEEKYTDVIISRELLRVIGTILNSKEIINQAEKGKEEVSVCRSLKLLAEENRKKGLREGISQGISQGISNSIILLLKAGQELNVAVADCAVQFEMSENEVWNIWNAR